MANKGRRIHKGSQLLASVLVNAIYAMINYPVMMVNSLMAPLSLIIIITFISRGALIGTAIIGGIIMSMVSAGISLQGDLSHLKNDFKLQDMVVSSETGPVTYLVGMSLGELVYFIPTLILLTILAIIFIHTSALGWLTIIAASLAIFAFSTALGFFFSNISSDVMQSWAFGGLLSTLLSTLPPVYYPITYLPLPWRYLAYLSPTTYVAQIAQSAAGILTVSGNVLVIDWVVIIALLVIVSIIAAKKSRWTDK